ncbi:MAG: hypothetical protein ACUVQP_08020 [Bacteroidales bacterium]
MILVIALTLIAGLIFNIIASFKFYKLLDDITTSLLYIARNDFTLDSSTRNNQKEKLDNDNDKIDNETLNAFFDGMKIDENRFDVQNIDGKLQRVKERKILDDMLVNEIINDENNQILF